MKDGRGREQICYPGFPTGDRRKKLETTVTDATSFIRLTTEDKVLVVDPEMDAWEETESYGSAVDQSKGSRNNI